MLKAAHFQLQILTAERRQAIGLAAARSILLGNAFDPRVIQQTPQRAIEGARAKDDTAITHFLDVFQNGVSMPRLIGETEKNEQNRFCKRRSLHYASQ